ncbi:MAG: hypothetical protein ACI4TU_04525 [Candidatus Cryptobacteroides sp.]
MQQDSLTYNPVMPVDSAFTQSTLALPSQPVAEPLSQGSQSLAFEILACVSLFVILLILRKIVNVFPSLIACVMRWKESVNLEASVKLSRDRNVIALALAIPFCLIVEHFGLFSPSYMNGWGESMRILIVSGTFLLYGALRLTTAFFCRPKKQSDKNYVIGGKSMFTYFILLTLLLLCVGGVCEFISVRDTLTKEILLWLTGATYLFATFREFQIFVSSYSIFTAFLYICALELMPTGILLATHFIF